MKIIKQRHKNGCGIASVAMISGISYQKALTTIFPNRKPREQFPGVQPEIFERVFDDLGIRHKSLDVRGKKIDIMTLKHNAILCYYANKKKTLGHAVAFDVSRKMILNPATGKKYHINFQRNYIQKNLYWIVEIKNAQL